MDALAELDNLADPLGHKAGGVAANLTGDDAARQVEDDVGLGAPVVEAELAGKLQAYPYLRLLSLNNRLISIDLRQKIQQVLIVRLHFFWNIH